MHGIDASEPVIRRIACSISPYDIKPVSGKPCAAATEKPEAKVTGKPAFSMRRADSASKQHGITWHPGLASSVRRREAADIAGRRA